MQYLFNILLCCAMIAGVFTFATTQKKGKSVIGEFVEKSGLNQAETDARTIGRQLARDDEKIDRDAQDIDDKMERQREESQRARERMQELQDRNAAQKMRLQDQMDRLKGR